MKRREFIKSSSVVGSSSLLFACGGRTIEPISLPLQGSSLIIEKQRLANGPLLVAHPSERYPISIYALGDNRYAACLMQCTHQKCETAPNEEGYICPCHGARYDKQGKVTKGPAEQNLPNYPITDLGDKLQLELGIA